MTFFYCFPPQLLPTSSIEVYDQLADLFLNPPRGLAKNVIAIED
jgi:hypothetical protein